MNRLLAVIAAVAVLVAVGAVAFAVGTRTAPGAQAQPTVADVAAGFERSPSREPAGETAFPAESCDGLADAVRPTVNALADEFHERGATTSEFARLRGDLMTADWTLCDGENFPSQVDGIILDIRDGHVMEDFTYELFLSSFEEIRYGDAAVDSGEYTPILLAEAVFAKTGSADRYDCVGPYHAGAVVTSTVEVTNTGSARAEFTVRVDVGVGENRYVAEGFRSTPPLDPGESATISVKASLDQPALWTHGGWCQISEVYAN